MADNLTLNAGTGGSTLATDDIAGTHYQIAKLAYGALDAATIVSTAAGLPVQQQGTFNVTNVSGTVSLPTGAATAAKQPALGTAGTASADVLSVQGVASMTALKTDGSGVTQPVSGTFWQATQPVSAAALPLPTGASTAAKQPALGTAGTASSDVLTVQGIASMTALKVDASATTQPVSGTFWQATQPVSAASLPLPSGAATAAKQPALGTAGTASTDVLSVQGIASMTALKVDGSAVTQPVSGTFWQATQPVSLASVPSHAVTNAGTFAVQAADAGVAAHDAAISGNPVRMGARALTSDYTAVAAGDTADLITTLLGKLVTIPYANPANTWTYAAPAGGLVSTTGVTAKAAAGAGVRIYVTDVQVINSHATVSTEVVINDGAAGTVLHRGWAQAAGGGYSIHFAVPLRGTANTLLEIKEVSGTATAGVLVNLQGYTAAE